MRLFSITGKEEFRTSDGLALLKGDTFTQEMMDREKCVCSLTALRRSTVRGISLYEIGF